MKLEEIKENLCEFDVRNPNVSDSFDSEELEAYKQRKEKGECYCDNCFYHRTELAEELLKYFAEKEN